MSKNLKISKTLKFFMSVFISAIMLINSMTFSVFAEDDFIFYSQPTEFKDINDKVSYDELLITILEQVQSSKNETSMKDIFAHLANSASPNLPNNTGADEPTSDLKSQPGSTVNAEVTDAVLAEISALGKTAGGPITDTEVLKWKQAINEVLSRSNNTHSFDDSKINFDMIAPIIKTESSGYTESLNMSSSFIAYGLFQHTGSVNTSSPHNKISNYISHLKDDLDNCDEWLGSALYKDAVSNHDSYEITAAHTTNSNANLGGLLGYKCAVKSLKELNLDSITNSYQSYSDLLNNPYIAVDYTISDLTQKVHNNKNNGNEVQKTYPYLCAVYQHNKGSGPSDISGLSNDYVSKYIANFGRIE